MTIIRTPKLTDEMMRRILRKALEEEKITRWNERKKRRKDDT